MDPLAALLLGFYAWIVIINAFCCKVAISLCSIIESNTKLNNSCTDSGVKLLSCVPPVWHLWPSSSHRRDLFYCSWLVGQQLRLSGAAEISFVHTREMT